MKSQNAAYLAAAGFGNPGFSNTGSSSILPNLGRSTKLSFPKTDLSAIGKKTMESGASAKLRPGVLTYLTNSDYDYIVEKTTKRRGKRDVPLVTKDYEQAEAKMTTAAGMSHGKAFGAQIHKEAEGGGSAGKESLAEDAAEDAATEPVGSDSGSESEAEAAEAAPTAASGAIAAAVAKEEGEGAPPASSSIASVETTVREGDAAPQEGGGGSAAAAAAAAEPEKMSPLDRVPEPGEVTREAYLGGERHHTPQKVALLNTILGAAVFGHGKEGGVKEGKPVMYSVVTSVAGLESLEGAIRVEIAKESDPKVKMVLRTALAVVVADKKELSAKK
jgi:hypothetical protein